MNWDLVKDWGPLFLSAATAIGGAIWLLAKRLAHTEFATVEDTRALATALKDAIGDLQEQIDDGRHKREMLEKDVHNLPGFNQVNELKEKMGEIREEQSSAATELRLLREQVGRIDEFLRNHQR